MAQQEFVVYNGILVDYHGAGGEVVIPKKVRKIEATAFRGNKTIEKLVLHEKVELVESGAFAGCTNLRQFECQESKESRYKAEGPCLYDYDSLHSAPSASGCFEIKPISTYFRIDEQAFAGCDGLEKLLLPDWLDCNLRFLSHCKNLREIQLVPGNHKYCLKLIDGALFEVNRDKGTLMLKWVPCDRVEFSIPDKTDSCSQYAFRNCKKLERLELPESFQTYYLKNAVQGCNNLRELVIPDQSREHQVVNGALLGGSGWWRDEVDTLLCAPSASGTYVIPQQVKTIERDAFADCKGLERVVIHKDVQDIRYDAFTGCDNLREFVVEPGNENYMAEGPLLYEMREKGRVLIAGPGFSGVLQVPEDVIAIGARAFWGNKALTGVEFAQQGSLEVIDAQVFQDCTGLTAIFLPQGLGSLYNEAFSGCENLTQVELPDTLSTFGGNIFHGCWQLEPFVVPDSVQSVNTEWDQLENDYHLLPPRNLFHSGQKVPVVLQETIEKIWGDKLTLEDWAGLYLFQTAKSHIEFCQHQMPKKPEQLVQAMLTLLANNKKKTAYTKAANYVIEHEGKIQPETIRALYDAAKVKKMAEAAQLLQPLLKEEGEAPGQAAQDGHHAFLNQFQLPKLLKHYKDYGGDLEQLKAVKLAQGEQAPQLLVLAAIIPYADCYSKATSRNDYQDTEIKFLPVSDQAAALLDHDSLMQLLQQDFLQHPAWLLPFCRFADGKRLQTILSESRQWSNWYGYGQKGREAQDVLTEQAILLSDCREALLYLEKNKWRLEEWAELRGTDAESVRDEKLAEFGLDETGKKVYDLGGNTVTVTLGMDLNLVIFDENAKKTVKSIPKRGADPEKHQVAKDDFAEMKKNIKKVVKSRCDDLFQQFLSGETTEGKAWQKSYLHNPVLGRVASLLVWSQQGKTFTLKDGEAIDCQGAAYQLTEEPITVAHPLEMTHEEVDAWQNYFNSNKIRQPFAQVWEPAIPADQVKPERYQDCEVPLYRFKGKEKHGISFYYSYGVSELELSFQDCDLELDTENAVWRHYMDIQEFVKLGKFTFENYSRQVNHIVAYLDRITIYGRIAKDDPTIVNSLQYATVAQVMEYIAYATEIKCPNVTAVLLEYKNQHFADFDPMAEFVLEDF